MAKRHGMSRSGSKKHFTHHAVRSHIKNNNRPVMRGGIRL